MTALSRQNTLFVSEDWIKVYEALENVDFRAYDMENYTQAIMTYLRVNYPDEFNDWIASSEFVTKIEVLAWLSQNIAFRVDLNTRENFLSTAERRASLIRLAQFISYKIDRVRGAKGEVKLQSIKTTQPIFDSNNISLQDRTISWNDVDDEDWYERFITIMNAAFTNRTQFGRPLVRHNGGGNQSTQIYRFNSVAPSTGTFTFNANISGYSLPFDIINSELDKTTGVVSELAPNGFNSLHILYRSDGRGLSSSNTGFFFPIRQGNLVFQDETFSEKQIIRTLDINASNINNDDFFVQELDSNGEVLETWTRTDNIFGEGIFFTTIFNENKTIYEVDTLPEDRVRVRFGDGSFGKIPTGNFRFWYRTSNADPLTVNPENITNKNITIPYVSNNQVYFLTLTYSLVSSINNAARTESNYDIRTRANKVYYTQNRMITGQDYNNFFLRDNAIRKVKTVNRTYSGHSRYTKLHDPTGLYENVKAVAEDGRIFEEPVANVQTAIADISKLSNSNLIIQYVSPLLEKEDKSLLYYNRYLELRVSNNLRWKTTSVVNGQSRGNIVRNTTPQIVGEGTSNNLFYVGADAIVRYDSLVGPIFGVERVIGDGTTENAIILDRIVPDNSPILSVFPAFRTAFTSDEITNVETNLDNLLDFGLTWNQLTNAWEIITFDNLDKESPFSLNYQNDVTGTNRDSSWMIYFEFQAGEQEDTWKIVDRGLGIHFESAREVDFYFVNNSSVVDPITGNVLRDRVRLLPSNEARDSLRRRDITFGDEYECTPIVYQFIGDGETSCFQTMETSIDETRVSVTINGVLLFYSVDWVLSPDFDGDSICIVGTPPDVGDVIEIRLGSSNSNINTTILATQFVGNNTTNQYSLETDDPLILNNMIVFMDGVSQDSNLDYGLGTIGFDNSIVLNTILPTDVSVIVHAYTGIDSQIFRRNRFVGNGTQFEFMLSSGNQTKNTILIFLDGVMQSSELYDLTTTNVSTTVSFFNTPGENVKIVVVSMTNPDTTRSQMFSFTPNGIQNNFQLTGFKNLESKHVMVFLDGIFQEGSYSSNPQYSITGNNTVQFVTPPLEQFSLDVFVIQGAVGSLSTNEETDTTPGNRGDISESSCAISYLGKEVDFNVVDVVRHSDGYVNANAISIAPPNANNRNFYDDPFLFAKLVIKNGLTDLVLWKKITEYGATVYDPISPSTVPKGTYGSSSKSGIAEGDEVDVTINRDGDIHYDVSTNTWLIANTISGIWEEAPDQTLYKKAIGRDSLKFIWEHYAADAHKINPSVSNIMDTYLLTTTYDDAYRTWLFNGGLSSEPIKPTSEELRIQFQEFEDFKALSDSIIYHPARYKPLFGFNAVTELQAIFKVIQTAGSTISENDLKLRILNVINDYFGVNRWNFGETLYFTELATYVHASLAPDVQSFVIVPKNNAQAFGRLFQIRSEPDELFISSATVDDIQIVSSLSDAELRIGTLS